MAYQFAFSTGTLETPSQPSDGPQKLVTPAPAPEISLFERLPSDIIKLILAELPKKDLVSLRSVEKKLRDMVTPLITNVQIPANLPNQEQVKRFFKDLTTVKFWEGKKPSEDFVNLFRHAPVGELNLSDGKINDENIKVIAPALPAGLLTFWLDRNSISDAGIQAMAPHLTASLLTLQLNKSNISDIGAQALADHFPTTLRSLSLGENNISEKGFQALLLKLSPTLELLNMNYNHIGDAGAQALAHKFLPLLEWLYLAQNNIGDDGAQALANNLPPTLKWLQLNGNNIGAIGLVTLLGAIPRTDLMFLFISLPPNSPFRELFENLHNRHGIPISVHLQ